jgi:hypothetical protein
MSSYVVIARFDQNTNDKLLILDEKLKASGYSISEWPPHITIAAYENIDENSICDWTSNFTKTHNEIIIGLHSINILPPGGEHTDTAVLCVNPAHSKKFVDFYYEFHEKFEECCTGIGYYNSISHGNPVMHATLAIIKINEFQSAMNIILKSNVFGNAKINALEVYTYPMKLIERYELGT